MVVNQRTTPRCRATLPSREAQGVTEPSLPPPGWYPDPSGAAMQRYFDGTDPSDLAGHDVEPLRGLAAPLVRPAVLWPTGSRVFATGFV